MIEHCMGLTPLDTGNIMRRLLTAIASLILTTGAVAGEFELPTLRGAASPFVPAPPIYTRWSGFYVGGQTGFSSSHFDFRTATADLVSHMLRELALEAVAHVSQWQVLGKHDTGSAIFGAFAGYNTQFDDVVIGIDVNYNRASQLLGQAPVTPIGRVAGAGGNVYLVDLTGSASMKIDDYASARLRGGWVIDNFLPYGTAGLALGRGAVTRSATVTGMQNPPTPPDPALCGPPTTPNCVPFAFTESEIKNNAFFFGWSVGGGVDVLLYSGLFLRAEYEYVSFAGISGIKAGINSGRVGAGWKF
jgi:outer membrane immunogenic protein